MQKRLTVSGCQCRNPSIPAICCSKSLLSSLDKCVLFNLILSKLLGAHAAFTLQSLLTSATTNTPKCRIFKNGPRDQDGAKHETDLVSHLSSNLLKMFLQTNTFCDDSVHFYMQVIIANMPSGQAFTFCRPEVNFISCPQMTVCSMAANSHQPRTSFRCKRRVSSLIENV